MNQPQWLVYLFFFLMLLGPQRGSTQTQINPKVGVESWSLKDEMDLSGNSNHAGQMIGFDVYIVQKRLVFVPGFNYHRISIVNREEGLNFKLAKTNGTHYFTIPLTFGIQLLDLPGIGAYVLAGGETTFFHSLDSNDIGLDDDELKGVFASLTAGAQVELLSILTLDIKYHYALHPILKSRPDSKLRGFTLAAGVKF